MEASISEKLLKTSSAGPFHVSLTDFEPSLNFSVEDSTLPLPFTLTKSGNPDSKLYWALIAANAVSVTAKNTMDKNMRFIQIIYVVQLANIAFFLEFQGSITHKIIKNLL